jgi:Leucine-rich repeat (LRR) protein
LAVGLLATVPILTACDGGATAPPETATTTLPSADTIVVAFPDANLEASIRAVLNKPKGSLYTSDLERIAQLDARGRDISDLTGLEHCVNLRWLDLGNNDTSDISPLAGIANLKELYLGDNNISDISPLAGLANLKELYLGDNNISDLSALFGLNNLKWLSLTNNNISDISVLAGLINLEGIHLTNNNISDISALVENSLFSEGDSVWLWYNPLSTTSVDVYIPQLEARGVLVTA